MDTMKLRHLCRHQMQWSVCDLLWPLGGKLNTDGLRADVLMPDDGDVDYLDALGVGDQVDIMAGSLADPAIRAEHLYHVARSTRRTVRSVLRCYRLWIAYRLGMLEGITQLGPAEIVAKIRDCDGATFSEWVVGGDWDAQRLGPVGERIACFKRALGELRDAA